MKIITLVFSIMLVTSCAYTPLQPVAQRRAPEKIYPSLIAESIRNDKKNYDRQYIMGAYDVTTDCVRILNAPKYKLIELCTDADIAYRRLKMQYPQYNYSGIDLYLLKLIGKMDSLRENVKMVDAVEGGYHPQEADYTRALNCLNEVKTLLDEIRPLASGMEEGLSS